MIRHHLKIPAGGFSILILLILGGFLLLSAQSALTAPSSPPQAPISLSVQETIRRALDHDLGIRIEGQDLQIKTAEIKAEKGRFDLRFNADVTNRFSINPRPVSVIEEAFVTTDLEHAQLDYQLGLGQRLLTGAEYQLSWSNTRTRGSLQLFNPSYRSAALLDFTQPLLKGFGTQVNRNRIRIAQNNLSISEEGFRAKVMDLLLEVQNLYWELVFQRQNRVVRQQSLEAAAALVEINREKARQGLLAPVEILVAEADVAAREEAVLIAEKQWRDAEDRLRRLIQPAEMSGEARLIPTDSPIQEGQQGDPEGQDPTDLGPIVQTALAQRPELKQARIQLQNRRISLQVAQNQTLPSLDLQAGAGINGLGESFGSDLDTLTSRDFYSWQAGLLLSFPLRNRTAKAELAKSRVELKRNRIGLLDLEAQAILEVKEAVRRVQTDSRRIEATRKARFLAQKKLEVETERFKVGLSTTHDVLEFQNDLAQAQVNELKAVLDYNRSLTHLDRVKGTILNQHDITLIQ